MCDLSCPTQKHPIVDQHKKNHHLVKIAGLLFLALGAFAVPAFAGPGATITLVPGISTLAGTGSPGLATSPTQANTAQLLGPVALETDAAGNVYMADGQRNTVWKINRQTGVMAIFAGIPGPSGQTGDGGPAASAKFRGPEGLRLDQAGNLYIVDTGNFAVRKVDTNGIITTYAGQLHVSGYTGDGGLATSATLGGPSYIALDHAGNLYISDLINNVIRRVDATTHIITTIAGNNTSGFSGDGGAATSAQLSSPNGLAFDSKGNLYICDRGNNAVREVAAATGVISTVAGTGGSSGSTGDGGPATSALLNFPWSLTLDSNDNLYIGDFLNGAVRKVDAISQNISTVAGIIGSQGNSGDGGPATAAQISNPTDLAFDNMGHLYIADLISTTVRQVDFQSSFPNTAVGSTSSPQNLVLHITGTVTLNLIGVPNSQGGNAEFTPGSLTGVGCVGGSPIVGGVLGVNCVMSIAFSPRYPGVRRVPLAISATVGSTAKGFLLGLTGIGLGPQAGFTPALITTVAGTGTPGYTGDGGVATAAEFQQPSAVAVDFQGNLFISDFGKHVVRRVDANTNIVTTITGNGTAGYSGDFGLATDATLDSPSGLSFDGIDSLYVSDSGNQAVRKIDVITGNITTFAGDGLANYTGDGGIANSAALNSPKDLVFDNVGSLYIADFANDAIRRIQATPPLITTAAGNGSAGGTGDGGLAVSALLNGPAAIATDVAGNIYIADNANNVIRKITASGKGITTIAGNGTAGFSGDGGLATSAKFSNPQGLAADSAGNLYITDSANNVFRKLNALTQKIDTFAGDKIANASGYTGDNGAATSALLNAPTHPAVDAAGNIYFADGGNGVVREIAGAAPLAFGNVHMNSASAAQDVTITNNGNAALTISGLGLPTDFNLNGALTTCTVSTSLAPAASCVLGVVFAPTATGALNETLTITDNQGTQTISLAGTGLIALPSTSTTTAFTVSPVPPVSGQPVIFTANVLPVPTGSPLGTVSFFDGATLLGTATVNASGVAVFTDADLADGIYTVTAVYSGNSASAGSTSSPLTVTLAPQFNVTAPPAPISAARGSSVNVTINVPPIGSTFNSQVTMSASGLPAGATASFNPPVVTPGSTGATTVMTITFAGTATASSNSLPIPPQPTPLMPFAITALGMAAIFVQRKKLATQFARPLTAALVTVTLLAAPILFVGCNGGFAGTGNAPQTVVVTVTGTSGAIQHSTTVTIHLQ
jgi:trimeric autotransporter adhesin